MNPASLSRSRYCLLTGAGPAAIAVVRLGGPAMAGFLSRHLRPLPVLGTMPAEGPQRATLLAADGLPLDDVLLLIEGAETERIVELHTHGGPAIVATLTEMLARSGFEQDETPDDLWPLATSLEAEAWALLPRLSTLAGTRWLAAQPQRLEAALREILTMADAEQAAACRALSNAPPAAEWYARAARLALVGPPGAGKSSLMNRLADRPVSIVSPQPGTTRDWVEAEGEIAGFPVCWVDTAGLRDTPDTLEAAGIAATHDVLAGGTARGSGWVDRTRRPRGASWLSSGG